MLSYHTLNPHKEQPENLGTCRLDYIFVPNCLCNEIYSAKTFDLSVENTSESKSVCIYDKGITYCTKMRIAYNLNNFNNAQKLPTYDD